MNKDTKSEAAKALVSAGAAIVKAVSALSENLSDATWSELNPDERLEVWDAVKAVVNYEDTLKDIVRKGFADGNEVTCLFLAGAGGKASLSKNWSGVFKLVQENWPDISEEMLKTTLKCNITDLEKVCLPFVEKKIAEEGIMDTIDGVTAPMGAGKLFRKKLSKYITVSKATPAIKDKRNAK